MPFKSSSGDKQTNQEFIIKSIAATNGGIPVFSASGVVDTLVFRTTVSTNTYTDDFMATVGWVLNKLNGSASASHTHTIADVTGLQTALDNKENTISILGIAKGGTGVSTTPTDGRILIGNGTGYTLANITAGNLITVTNSAGGITIATTANNYVHPTGDGNLHVPVNGTTNNGKFLKSGAAAGSISWETLTVSDLTALTASRAIVSDGSGKLAIATTTATEIGYLSGVTSSIQTQLGTKENTSNKNIANGYAGLDAGAKIPTSLLPDSILGQVAYKGTYNANTNTPALPTASTVKGNYYVVSVAGTQQTISFEIGDWVISNGTSWEKVDNTDSVTSVYGRMGAVVAVAGDYTASQITNTPAGSITATTVQAALNDLDTSKSSTSHTHSNATTGVAGFMSNTDKSKLDGIAASANNYSHPTGDGNLHVPVTGTTNNLKVLKAGATAGVFAWGNVAYSELTGTPSTFTPSAHTHTWDEITGKPSTFTPAAHSHVISDVTGLQGALDAKANTSHTHLWADITDKPSTFAPSAHTHAIADVTGLQTALDGKANTSHTHLWADITDKPSTFAPSAHTHTIADVTGLQTALNAKSDTSHSHSNATTGAAGFMSNTDKTKLDGIATNANNYSHPTGDGNLHVPVTSTTNDGKYLRAGATAGVFSWQTLDMSHASGVISDAQHGSKTTGTLHAVATTGVAGFMSSTDKSKLDGIAASANNYSHPTGDGNLHVPVTGTTNNLKVLKAGATAGVFAWGNVAYSELTGTPSTFTPSAHTHPISDVTNLQSALDDKLSVSYLTGRTTSNPNTVQTNGVGAYYITSGATNKPTGTDHSLLSLSYNSSWTTQMAGDWRTNKFYTRVQNNGTWTSWETLANESWVTDKGYLTSVSLNTLTDSTITSATAGDVLRHDGTVWRNAVLSLSDLSALSTNKAAITDANGKVTNHTTTTSTEVGYLTGVTSAIQTQLNGKQATITGGATTIATSNLTASRALVSDGSGKVAVATTTSTEMGYLSGVTSAIQTQLNGKQATITGGATTIATSNLTASRALVSDGSGKVAVATTTSTEMGYLSGVTSAIQTQLNGKQDSLGFTPVQQNGGIGQGTNKVYIGWSTEADTAGNQRLKATVDLTDIGSIVFDRELNRELALKSNTTHTHATLIPADTRSVNTLPSAYSYKLAPEFKITTTVGLTGDYYTGVIGFSPWQGTTGSGGGNAYQLGFNGTKLSMRSGIDSTWNSWKTVSFIEDATHLNTANTIVKRDAWGGIQSTWIGATAGLELATGLGTNGMYVGNGDAATRTTHNMFLRGHWGMAFKTYDETVTGVLDFRSGSFDMNGSYTGRNFVNNIDTGEKSFKFNTTANSAGFGLYGHSTTIGLYDWEKGYGLLGINRTSKAATFDGIVTAQSLESTNIIRLKGTSYSTLSQEIFFHSNFGNNVFTAVLYRPANANQLRIRTGANNTTQTDKFTFDDNGDFTAVGDVFSNSDAKLKDNVVAYGTALDKVEALEPVRYQRNDLNNKEEIGFIAQAVKEIEPLVVGYNSETDIHSLDYGRMVVMLTQAVKELSAKVKKLENK